MMIKKIIVLLFLLSLTLQGQVQLFEMGSGKVLEGPEVEYKTGKLSLKMKDGQGTTLYDVTKISKIVSPMPPIVSSMWGAFLDGKFKLVGSDHGKKAEEDYRFLGWGKRVAFAYGCSLLQQGQVDEALKVFNRGIGHMRGGDDELDQQLLIIGTALVDYAKKNYDKAQSKLDGIAKKLLPGARPFFYNLQGDILLAQEKGSVAILSFYKTFLLDESSAYERGYAKTKIAELYTKFNDSRVNQINQLN